MGPPKSRIWKHFQRSSDDKAQCLLCSGHVYCKGGSTSTMWKHLNNFHEYEAKEIHLELEQEQSQPAKKAKTSVKPQRSMMDFVKRKSIEERMAKAIALDGISPFTIARSEFFGEACTALGLNLPKSHKTIMEMAHTFFKEAREETIREIKASGVKFSLTMDEWTSIANKRFLNVNIHSGSISFNLGLIRIQKSCPAEEVKRLMTE